MHLRLDPQTGGTKNVRWIDQKKMKWVIPFPRIRRLASSRGADYIAAAVGYKPGPRRVNDSLPRPICDVSRKIVLRPISKAVSTID